MRLAGPGFDWVFVKLAHDKRTKAPIEEHMRRPLLYVFWDLLALETKDGIFGEREQKRLRKLKQQQGIGRAKGLVRRR